MQCHVGAQVVDFKNNIYVYVKKESSFGFISLTGRQPKSLSWAISLS